MGRALHVPGRELRCRWDGPRLLFSDGVLLLPGTPGWIVRLVDEQLLGVCWDAVYDATSIYRGWWGEHALHLERVTVTGSAVPDPDTSWRIHCLRTEEDE